MPPVQSCRQIYDYAPVSQCDFAQEHCHLETICQYAVSYYCHAESPVLRNAVMLAYLLLLFSIMGIAAFDFMCPNLQGLALHSGLSQSVIGVTFLAFANSSVDVFGALAGIKAGTGSLAVGEIVGGVLFIDCVVLGSMAITGSFKVEKRIYVRDSVFVVISMISLLIVLRDGILTLTESLSLISLYIAYAAVVIYQHWNERVLEGELEESPLMADVEPVYLSRQSLYSAIESRRIEFEPLDGNNLRPSMTVPHGSYPVPVPQNDIPSGPFHRRASDPDVSTRMTPRDLPRLDTHMPVPASALGSVLRARSPLWSPESQSDAAGKYEWLTQLFPSYVGWHEKPYTARVVAVLMTLPIFIMTSSIPVPDTKLMRLHAVVSPLAAYFLLGGYNLIRWEVMFLIVIALLGAAHLSRRPPDTLIMGCGVLLAMFWVVFIAGELVGILQLLGIILQVSDAVMGITIFAVGDSLGDFISNLATLHVGLPMMALGACFGGPLFTVLIGIGGSALFVMLIRKETRLVLPTEPSITIAGLGLIFVLTVLLLALPFNDWRLNKSIGWFAIASWLVCVSLGLYYH